MAEVTKREVTNSIVIIYAGSEAEELARGSHCIVTPRGDVVHMRRLTSFGAVCDYLDDEAVYVCAVGQPDKLTDDQEIELDELIARLENTYGAKVIDTKGEPL